MESGFHLGVLRERPDVNVVLHFQSHYATAVACMKNRPTNFNVTAEIPCHVGSEIPVVPYYRPGSKELAQGVIDALKDHNSVLLLKHGQVVCGNGLHQDITDSGCLYRSGINGNTQSLGSQAVQQ